MKKKLNPFTNKFDYINTLEDLIGALVFKGSISLNSDFPILTDVQIGWFYVVLQNVTDNDPTKTNTGLNFVIGDEIVWDGTTWVNIGSVIAGKWNNDGTSVATGNWDIGAYSFTATDIIGDNLQLGDPLTSLFSPAMLTINNPLLPGFLIKAGGPAQPEMMIMQYNYDNVNGPYASRSVWHMENDSMYMNAYDDYNNGYIPMWFDASIINLNSNGGGNVLVGLGDDNGIDKLQVNGSLFVGDIYHSTPTFSTFEGLYTGFAFRTNAYDDYGVQWQVYADQSASGGPWVFGGTGGTHWLDFFPEIGDGLGNKIAFDPFGMGTQTLFGPAEKWQDLFATDGTVNIQPNTGNSAIVKIGGMEYSKDPGQAGISYMIQRENNTLDENSDPAVYGSILAFYSNGYNGAPSSINLGFDGHYYTAIAWEQSGMWGGQTGNITIDSHAWGLFNADGHSEFSYVHIGDTINGFVYPYDGYSFLQVDGNGSFRGSLQVYADTVYGGYGPSFDFNATPNGGGNWRMVSTGNDDGVGPGWFQFYLDPNYGSSPLAFSPDMRVIVNGVVGAEDFIHDLQVYGLSAFGDPTDGNYSEFEADGTYKMVGTARVKNEIQISALSAANGVSAPTIALRTIGASGGVKKAVSQFSKTVQQDVYFEFHGPDSIDDTVDVNFHLMWLPGSGWTSGNYMWKLEFLVKSENDTYNTGTPTTISANVTPANATGMIETEFATGINLNPQQILIGHFYRDVANDNADDTGDVNFFEVEFTQDKLGTPL